MTKQPQQVRPDGRRNSLQRPNDPFVPTIRIDMNSTYQHHRRRDLAAALPRVLPLALSPAPSGSSVAAISPCAGPPRWGSGSGNGRDLQKGRPWDRGYRTTLYAGPTDTSLRQAWFPVLGATEPRPNSRVGYRQFWDALKMGGREVVLDPGGVAEQPCQNVPLFISFSQN